MKERSVSNGIDIRLGSELGLSGRYSSMPAFQIVNDTHDRYLALTSRLIDLKYGPRGDAFEGNERWVSIDGRISELAAALDALGGDAVRAVALLEEINRLKYEMDGLAAEILAGGAADEL